MTQLRKIGTILGVLLPLRFGFMNAAVSATLLYFFLRFSFRNGIQPFSWSFLSAAEIIFSFITINLLVQLIELAAYRRTFIRIALQMLIIFSLWLFNNYYLTTHVPPDFSMMADNIGLSFSRDSFDVIKTTIEPVHFITSVFLIVGALAAQRKWKILTRTRQSEPLFLKLITVLSLWIVSVMAPLQTNDQITALAQDAYHRLFPGTRTVKPVNGYPYHKDSVPISGRFDGLHPDIIIVMIESFNANVIEAKTAVGKEITPEFNSLILHGLYYDRFYGNSIQTCKGQAATLLSVIPSVKGKIFTSYPKLNFKAFPEYLREAGYDTVFFQAAESLDFDNTEHFMKRAGFSDVRSAYEFLADFEKKSIGGWGPEDAVFYQAFDRYMLQRKKENGGKPVCAILATIANHMRFDHVPADKRHLYPHPTSIEQNYANAIHLTDMQLEGITRRSTTSNTVVIVTGDHSFPINEHGISHNENGFYDESFRVPFLVLYPGKIPPRRVSTRAYSQLDIAPTILDLAGVHAGNNSFMGTSLFIDAHDRPVFLVQPYHGTYLACIRYPYKYIVHRKTGQEYLFNLAIDPQERNNLFTAAGDDRIKIFRADIDSIWLNQRILDTTRLYSDTIHE